MLMPSQSRWVTRLESKQAGLDRIVNVRFAARASIQEFPRPADPEVTVGDAYNELVARIFGGEVVRCRVCQKDARVYFNRRISVRTAVDFLRLVPAWLKQPGPAQIGEFLPGTKPSKGAKSASDISYLNKWRLLRREGKGEYHLFPDGLAFALGRLRLPEYVVVYGNGLYGFHGAPVTIRDCLRAPPGRKQNSCEWHHDRFLQWVAEEGRELVARARVYWREQGVF